MNFNRNDKSQTILSTIEKNLTTRYELKNYQKHTESKQNPYEYNSEQFERYINNMKQSQKRLHQSIKDIEKPDDYRSTILVSPTLRKQNNSTLEKNQAKHKYISAIPQEKIKL